MGEPKLFLFYHTLDDKSIKSVTGAEFSENGIKVEKCKIKQKNY